MHSDEAALDDLTDRAYRLTTPGQRRLRLHVRWAERDLASLEHAEANEDTRSIMAFRATHTTFMCNTRGRASRPVAWEHLDNASMASPSKLE